MRSRITQHALLAILIAAGLALSPIASQAQSTGTPAAAKKPAQPAKKPVHYRVVLQVSDADPAKWNLALNNANNILHDLGKGNVAIEIVAYGPGIGMFKGDSKVADRLAQALDSNIVLDACENTMRNQKLDKADMYQGISYVPAGVVHIMKRQREGWQYIRP